MPNRLADATSPYLRQHRNNPVDWWPWCTEAFDDARTTGRPVLLSVGYSACHWCHVMAHESFEDHETAAIMNELFVNVKVDREERPDVDSVYMDAVQALTGRGGWPMTVFLTPDGEPFYGGTYWPREPFQQLLRAVDDAWRNRREELRQNVDALVEVVSRTARLAPAASYDAVALLRSAVSSLASSFDATWGGFGSAPKFPSTFGLDLMLRAHLERRDSDTERIVVTSLDAMASGGMWDHIGGGFSRYSVDDKWLVPHFEKMLYDQALLLRVYVHAWKVFGHERHRLVADEIVGYVLECLTDRDGGFYSAEDADSLDEHGHSEEGAFYTWTPAQVRDALGAGADEALEWWDITDRGNFEGRSIPNRVASRDTVVRPQSIESARRVLKSVREQRPRPGLDDKVLTEWNAMFLSSLCEAAAATGRADWIAAAERNGRFLLGNLRSRDGRWMRSWMAHPSPAASHTAVAHDLAHVVDAMTRLYELTGAHQWLDAAVDAAEQLLAHHWDVVNDGFFTVADDAEQLLARQKDLMDNATPSANSAAAAALWRLSALTGRDDFADASSRTLRLLATVMPSAPSAFCNAMGAVHMATEGLTEVVIPGDRADLVSVCAEKWRPNTVVAWGNPRPGPLWQGRIEGNAYVCRDGACRLPVDDTEALRRELAFVCFGG